MAAGVVQIGAMKWPPSMGGGVAVVSWDSSGKVDEKESDGKDDARTTWKGRKTGHVDIALSWKEDNGPIDAAAKTMLAALSPRGPNGGIPQEFVAEDQEIHNAHSIIITGLKGPVRTPGSGQASATLSASTWSKPKASGAGASGKGKTPAEAEVWKQSAAGASAAEAAGSAPADGAAQNAAKNSGFSGADAPTVTP